MIYFSQQQRFSLQCGKHSINNLLGREQYSTQDLNNICAQLSQEFCNPHKCCCGGDFDANVLMIALQRQQYECQWHDHRNTFEIISSDVGDNENLNNQNSQNHTEIKVVEREGIEREVLGYLVNVKIRGCLSFLGKLFCISSRHWLVIKKINNEYYILDSKDKKPIKLGSGEKAQNFLRQEQDNEAQILRVVEAHKKADDL